MKIIGYVKTVFVFFILATVCCGANAQINMTIDEAALNKNRIEAKPLPLKIYNDRGYFRVMMNALSGSLTSSDGSNSFPVSSIGYYHYDGLISERSSRSVNFGTDMEVSSAEIRDVVNSGFVDKLNYYPVLFINDLKASGWKAGTYSTALRFKLSTKIGKPSLDPGSATLTVEVLPLLKLLNTSLPGVTLEIDKLEYFRTGYKSNTPAAQTELSVMHTVPLTINLYAAKMEMSYTGTGSRTPQMPRVSSIGYHLEGRNGPGSAPASISSNGALFQIDNIPVGNTTQVTYSYKISADQLKQSFRWEGSYETKGALTLKIAKDYYNTGSLYVATSVPSLKVVVGELKEFAVKDKDVQFSFKTASDYRNGLVKDMPAHLRVSSTKPYQVTVQAETATFSLNGKPSALPCSILEIGSVDGQASLNKVTLSTNAQPLLSAAEPGIDTDIDVRYKIPANPLLVPAESGTYQLKLIYSMSAL